MTKRRSRKGNQDQDLQAMIEVGQRENLQGLDQNHEGNIQDQNLEIETVAERKKTDTGKDPNPGLEVTKDPHHEEDPSLQEERRKAAHDQERGARYFHSFKI